MQFSSVTQFNLFCCLFFGGGKDLLRLVTLKLISTSLKILCCKSLSFGFTFPSSLTDSTKRNPLFPLLMALPLSFLHLMIVSHKSIKSSINILNMQTMPSEGQSFGSRLKNSNKPFIINYYICNIFLLSSLSSSRSCDPQVEYYLHLVDLE